MQKKKQQGEKIMFKFYIAFYTAKFIMFGIKLLKRLKIVKCKASFFPGKVALKIDKDFLTKVSKPKEIIAVTGTNGKTTVCNLLIGALESSGKKVLDNRLGANINSGVASAFIAGSTLTNKTKYDVAVLEVDERSSIKVYSYITPTYLVCTNLFRDSIKRNAHPEFIFNIINGALPKETKLILNADDLISSRLGNGNKAVYFAIDKLPTDKTESVNIINDMRVCPKCHTKLKYNYVRYHHIGNEYCPNCDFKSPEADFRVSNIDFENRKLTIEHNGETNSYNLISDSIFNIYNELAVISALTEIGLTEEQIKNAFEKEKIVESRYQEKTVDGIKIVSHLAKGQNPVACSCVCDYVKNEKGKKEVVLVLFDRYDAKETSESMVWLYDCDFEFLNDESIDRVVIGGPRSEDFYLRLLIAGVPREKLVFTKNTEKIADCLSLNKGTDIYILYDIYNGELADDIREHIEKRIAGGEANA